MSDDLIKRADAINLCGKWRNRTNEHHDKNGWYIADTLLKAIKELPSADRPQGEWIKFGLGRGTRILFCTNCERRIEVPLSQGDSNYDYCANCGARMKGADDGE